MKLSILDMAADDTIGLEFEIIVPHCGRISVAQQTITRAIQEVMGGDIFNDRIVYLEDGRKWLVKGDGSIYPNGDNDVPREVVSPILTVKDLPKVYELCRLWQSLGIYTNRSCGGHIHLGAHKLDARKTANLCRLVNKHKAFLLDSVGTFESRRRFCYDIPDTFIRWLDENRWADNREVERSWRRHTSMYPYSEDASGGKYLVLKLDWYKGTVEFRFPNGTIDPLQLDAHIKLVLGLYNKAVNMVQSSSKFKPRRYTDADVRDFRVFLNQIGLAGKENKQARTWLVDTLSARYR